MKRLLPFLVLIISFLSCKNDVKTDTTKETIKEDTELKELFTLMQGSFNSEVQSQVDSSYYNISLHMYPIWEDKEGHFLYVEQALNRMQDRPYRQRIYEVTRASDSTFSSAVYKLDVDSLWIGKWKTPKAFDSISLKDIALKEGCEVILKRLAPNHYMGKTGDETCVSTMRGASYARSEVEILEDKIMSWDRGFDAEGNYVWGAEKGPYIFNKLD
ncbi:chromophore lyase CpcT/CpeT [uncultured Winogradskyella sp.]|uniref:chromophore lyase CpcT/CpeT n=1 Tax=uncultured Winogradskyella sp. TaxID=395353 RepID=UPI00261AE9F6|nr:chromophore lyase CpcT/CpeT [uncultured Winogradskyella sp.]